MVEKIKFAMGTLLLCAALGPYLTAGLRFDHVAILLLGAVSVLLVLLMRATVPIRFQILITILLVGAVITMISDSIVAPKYRLASYTSGIGRMLLPAVIMLICAFLLAKKRALDEAHAKYYFSVIVWVAALSGFITVLSLFLDLSWIESFYSVGGEAGVWSQAKSLGRYTGLFNQPLEAGVFYSTALFVVVFITHSSVKVNWNKTFFLVLIVAGGALSLSKNFMVVGSVLSLYLLYSLSKKVFFRTLVVALFAIFLIGLAFLTFSEDSLYFIESLIDIYENDGLMSAMTAGRFGGFEGEKTDVEILFSRLFDISPLTGFGVNTQLPLDNGYLEYGYQGGIFAMMSNVMFFVVLLFYSLRSVSDYSKLLFVLAIYGLIASMGGPVITANRANISYVFCICICLYYSRTPRSVSASTKRRV